MFKSVTTLFLMIAGLLTFLSSAFAQEVMTLEDALARAGQSNPQIQAAKARLGVSDAQILSAGARLNPNLISDNGIAEKTYRLGLEKTFELGGKRQKRIAVAEALRGSTLAEIQTLLLDIRANVRRAYTRLYSLQERERSLQLVVQSHDRLLVIAERREAAGDIAQVDVLQAEVASLTARNDAETLSYELTQARNTLNALLNQPGGLTISLLPPDNFPKSIPALISTEENNSLETSDSGSVSNFHSDPDRLVKTALTTRPELLENQRQQEVTTRQLALSKANRTPNLSLSAGPDVVVGDGGSVNAFLSGNLQLPILNRQEGPIAEAQARQVLLSAEQTALQKRIELEVSQAYNAFLQNRGRIIRYETLILPKSEVLIQKSQRAFEIGKASILIPINAQQAYRNTQLGYQQALLDYQNAISDLERAIGAGL